MTPQLNVTERTAKHNFVSVHDVCLQCLNSCCLKPLVGLPLSNQRGGYGTSDKTMETLFFLLSAELTHEQKVRLNYSLTPRNGHCKIYVRSDKTNLYGVSTLLCTSQGQQYPTPDILPLSSFSRKRNSVKMKDYCVKLST